MRQQQRKQIPRGLIIDVQRDIIRRRKEDVDQDPTLIDSDRWDLSKIFYDTRTILDRQGYDTSEMNKPDKRKSIHNAVADICEQLGIRRHEMRSR